MGGARWSSVVPKIYFDKCCVIRSIVFPLYPSLESPDCFLLVQRVLQTSALYTLPENLANPTRPELFYNSLSRIERGEERRNKKNSCKKWDLALEISSRWCSKTLMFLPGMFFLSFPTLPFLPISSNAPGKF